MFKRKRPSAKTKAVEIESACTHPHIYFEAAETTKTPYGYMYLVALLKCKDCDEEWKLQGRTAGRFSDDPESNVYRDAERFGRHKADAQANYRFRYRSDPYSEPVFQINGPNVRSEEYQERKEDAEDLVKKRRPRKPK